VLASDEVSAASCADDCGDIMRRHRASRGWAKHGEIGARDRGACGDVAGNADAAAL
jgi:hypothetical protein